MSENEENEEKGENGEIEEKEPCPATIRKNKKILKKRIPDKLFPISNPDKLFFEEWYPSRNKINIPHPFRLCAFGRPNCGKTSIVKHILLRARPKFKKLFVIHCDSDYTQEYDDAGGVMLKKIPAPTEWEGKEKTLVVLDDLEYKTASKEQKYNLDRLFGFCSTHKNISVILCAQDAFNVPPSVRRMSNFWILWAGDDIDAMATCARKSGIKADELKYIFKNIATRPHDSLWLDRTKGTKYPMRLNGFRIMKKI